MPEEEMKQLLTRVPMPTYHKLVEAAAKETIEKGKRVSVTEVAARLLKENVK